MHEDGFGAFASQLQDGQPDSLDDGAFDHEALQAVAACLG
jgi:hypothetical protein